MSFFLVYDTLNSDWASKIHFWTAFIVHEQSLETTVWNGSRNSEGQYFTIRHWRFILFFTELSEKYRTTSRFFLVFGTFKLEALFALSNAVNSAPYFYINLRKIEKTR